MNKIIARLIAALLFIFPLALNAQNRQVEAKPELVVWFKDANGGGSSHLNESNEYKTEGSTDGSLNNKIVYSIKFKNSATLQHGTSFQFISVFELEKNGKKTETTIKKKIEENGTIKVTISEGIYMEIITKGLTDVGT
jgi:hypothetical protein